MKLFYDAIGVAHEPVASLQNTRIVCLVPSITELLCDLGLAPYLVGRTGFCIHPAECVAKILKIGGTKDVNINKIRSLQPTHLIVNIDENERPTVEQCSQFIPHIVVTHPNTVTDNFALYRLLGGIFGVLSQAEALCKALSLVQAEVQANLDELAPKQVLYCIWKDPWMTISADTYIADMLSYKAWHQVDAATENASSAIARYPVFDWSATWIKQVDLILLSSEPYRFTEQEVASVAQQTGKPVRLVDGEMLSWYGSRAIAGLAYLRDL